MNDRSYSRPDRPPRLREIAAGARWTLFAISGVLVVLYFPHSGRALVRDRHGRIDLLCGAFYATPDGRIAGGRSLAFLGGPEAAP